MKDLLQVIQEAARDLPDNGCRVELCIEHGYAGVDFYTADGDRVSFDGGDCNLAEQVEVATGTLIELARPKIVS